MRSKFHDIENNIKKRVSAFSTNEVVSTKKKLESTQIKVSSMRKKQLHPLFFSALKKMFDLTKHLERYTNTLPAFGFNTVRYNINLIKSYLIHYLINGKDIVTSIIKKVDHCALFKFGDILLLNIMKLLGGATTLDFFIKTYKASELKGYFLYEWFDSSIELDEQQLPPGDNFDDKLKNSKTLDKK